MSADFDPTLDLEINRWLRATPAQLWRAWSDPDLMKQWWVPKPVEIVEIIHDFRPGGRFCTSMRLPDGTEMTYDGCFLEVEHERMITMTECLTAGYRPTGSSFMTARVTMTPEGAGTAYRAHAMHAKAEDRDTHEKMGFFDGWGTVIRQLEEIAVTL